MTSMPKHLRLAERAIAALRSLHRRSKTRRLEKGHSETLDFVPRIDESHPAPCSGSQITEAVVEFADDLLERTTVTQVRGPDGGGSRHFRG